LVDFPLMPWMCFKWSRAVLVVTLMYKIFEKSFYLHNWHSLFFDSLSCHKYCQIMDFYPTWLLISTKLGFGELIFNFSQLCILRQNGPIKMQEKTLELLLFFVVLPLLFRIILWHHIFLSILVFLIIFNLS
jgi:hypothetical protein